MEENDDDDDDEEMGMTRDTNLMQQFYLLS
jgi:hypothetical protein